MDLHLYVPAMITLGAAVIAVPVGAVSLLSGITDAEPDFGQYFRMGTGIVLLYAAPVAALVAIGMQIAHWV